MDIMSQVFISKAVLYTGAKWIGHAWRFWDTDRASWYAIGPEEMAELGEMLLDRPAENAASYDTWIDMYCDRVDSDQSNRDHVAI